METSWKSGERATDLKFFSWDTLYKLELRSTLNWVQYTCSWITYFIRLVARPGHYNCILDLRFVEYICSQTIYGTSKMEIV